MAEPWNTVVALSVGLLLVLLPVIFLAVFGMRETDDE